MTRNISLLMIFCLPLIASGCATVPISAAASAGAVAGSASEREFQKYPSVPTAPRGVQAEPAVPVKRYQLYPPLTPAGLVNDPATLGLWNLNEATGQYSLQAPFDFKNKNYAPQQLRGPVVYRVSPEHNVIPPEGYVLDADTAIAIAVAVWGPIYGEDNISREKPFAVSLLNGVWTVEGSLPKGMMGGVAVAEIAKADGRILRVSHGK
jgi:NTF2 fold immunity protein